MKSVVLESAGNVKIEDMEEPGDIPEGYVKIRVQSVGICGSDVHYYLHGKIGDFVLRKPMILGHETGGIAKSGGASIKKGSVVAVEPGIPCGKCIYCRTGRYNLCPDMRFFATPPVDGSMVEHIVHPEGFVYSADGLTPDEASLAEPLSVGVYAARMAHLGPDSGVLINGSGPVGILTAFAAESYGANVTVVDINPERIEYAGECGFSSCINNKISRQFDSVFECSGYGHEYSIHRTARGGDLFLIGIGEEDGINPLMASIGGINIHGIFRYANTYPEAIRIIKRYRNRLAPFLRKHIDADELPGYLADGEYEKYLKTIVRI
ncbi:MAG: alcohol dehydrogenase catalytic domain-containing protein [Ferroplasma sp.]|uniref:alcohol dehydrogenase catalytic domain-containing protein n=1 Tax=Ferroplasma sp. TaxID=2591003 RepID=UPI0028150BAE|nr:alcohol dehydrogenase catalytic domain-containing protein [Ferroplasma sp.]WMT50720.1 MAG: alcohol dehydrogenase catalytic domain-containing protein [Ferroplasma sp.]